MKWKVTIGLLAILMGIFGSSLWSQEKNVAAPQKGNGGWVQLASGVRVLRMWETKNGPKKWPEIAALELSDSQYADFKKDVSGFLNKQQVFSQPVQPGATNNELPMSPSSTKHNGWNSICAHTMTSASICISGAREEEK